MEITVRHVIELSPSVEALLRLLVGGLDEDRRRVGVRAPPASGAPGPSPVAEAGPSPQAAAPVQAPAPAASAMAPAFSRNNGKTYRTPERQAVLVQEWPGRLTMRALHARLNGMAGPMMPAAHACVYHWAEELGLGPRPGRENLQRHAAQQRPKAVGLRGATYAYGVPPAPAMETAAAPKAAAPAGPGEAPAVSQAPPSSQWVPPPPPPPLLPLPVNGKIYARFADIRAWAGFFGVSYDGANIDRINKLRAAKGLLPVVQDDTAPAAPARAQEAA